MSALFTGNRAETSRADMRLASAFIHLTILPDSLFPLDSIMAWNFGSRSTFGFFALFVSTESNTVSPFSTKSDSGVLRQSFGSTSKLTDANSSSMSLIAKAP